MMTGIFSRSQAGYLVGSPRPAKPGNSLADLHPDIANEWSSVRNGAVTPSSISARTAYMAWWECNRCHFVWAARVASRSGGTGCPPCGRRATAKRLATPPTGRSLADVDPFLTYEWDYVKNESTPQDIFASSNKPAHWICLVCAREWTTSPNLRHQGTGCYTCGRTQSVQAQVWRPRKGVTLADGAPHLLDDWDYAANGSVEPGAIALWSSKKIIWKCAVCGYGWAASVSNRAAGRKCESCSKSLVSAQEQKIRDQLSTTFRIASLESDGHLKHPAMARKLRPDIYLPEQQVVVEYDGNYWHRNTAARDLLRVQQYADLGIQLIRIREAPLRILGPNDLCVPRMTYRNAESIAKSVLRHVVQVVNCQQAASPHPPQRRLGS